LGGVENEGKALKLCRLKPRDSNTLNIFIKYEEPFTAAGEI